MKAFVLFLSPATFVFMHCIAQGQEQPYVYLTGYTIPKESNTIGYVKTRGAEIKSVAVEGEQSAAFEIAENHKLVIRRKKLKGSLPWFDVKLNVKTSAGEVSRTFRIVKDNFVRNRVIAHRGAWKNTGVPENSIAALRHAVTLGCEGSEFDVHMSADSVPLVNHDPAIQ